MVEVCVNTVGVDVNTASSRLLEHIAGLNARISKAVIEYRDQNGSFQTRADLLKVKGLGKKAYEQAAGFLRVHGGKEELDATSIHPEAPSKPDNLDFRHLNFYPVLSCSLTPRQKSFSGAVSRNLIDF